MSTYKDNYIEVKGRLGQLVEVKKSESGKSVANFDIALMQSKSGKEAEWLPLRAWESVAEDLTKVQVGDILAIVGKVVVRTWKDDTGTHKKWVFADVKRFVNLTEEFRNKKESE